MLDGLIRDYESALRASFGADGLPKEWEEKLAGIPRTTPMGRLRTWKQLAIYSEVRHQARVQEREVDHDAAQEAARQLLRREPVEVQIGPHVVGLTSRSYAAMAALARHDARIRLLRADAEYVDARMRQLTDALPGSEQAERKGVRRKLRRLLAMSDRVNEEILRQRRALWAHALTPSGAPATGVDHVPDWWSEIDPIWDATLLMGLMQAGAGRYATLGEAPRAQREGKEPAEDFGWGSLFATVERQNKLPPASLYDVDLYQLLTWLRAGAEPVPEELGG